MSESKNMPESGYEKSLESIENTVTALRRCFLKGSYEHMSPDGDSTLLTMDNLYDLLKFTSAYYSWTATIWANCKSAYDNAEQRRKLSESKELLHYSAKKKETKDNVKELEAKASVASEEHIETEMMWRSLYSRATSCKLAMEKFIDAIDSLKYMRNKEWNSNV